MNTNVLTVLSGNGAGALTTFATINGPSSAGLASADFNADGKSDLFFANDNLKTIDLLLAS